MIRVILAASLCLATVPAFAQTTSCSVQASEKKLSGAARTSFTKKCQADATISCEKASTDKKLAGAAKNSFVKKCVNDAVGS